MNDLVKWESSILNNDLKTRVSKFLVVSKFLENIIFELSKKIDTSKKEIDKECNSSFSHLSNSIRKIKKDSISTVAPLKGVLEINYKRYMKFYSKYYNELDEKDKVLLLDPKKISKTILNNFNERYSYLKEEISNTLDNYKDQVFEETKKITKPYKDSYSTLTEFNKNMSGNIKELNRDFNNIFKLIRLETNDFILQYKGDNLNSKFVDEKTSNLLKHRKDLESSLDKFRFQSKSEFFKSEQDLIFSIKESNLISSKKNDMESFDTINFPDIKNIIESNLNDTSNKILLMNEKINNVIPKEKVKELDEMFSRDLGQISSLFLENLDYTSEYMKKQYVDILDVVDNQLSSLNLIYIFLGSIKRIYLQKNEIIENTLSSMLSTFSSISKRAVAKNEIEMTNKKIKV